MYMLFCSLHTQYTQSIWHVQMILGKKQITEVIFFLEDSMYKFQYRKQLHSLPCQSLHTLITLNLGCDENEWNGKNIFGHYSSRTATPFRAPSYTCQNTGRLSTKSVFKAL